MLLMFNVCVSETFSCFHMAKIYIKKAVEKGFSLHRRGKIPKK